MNTAEIIILTFAFSFLDLHFYRIGSQKKVLILKYEDLKV